MSVIESLDIKNIRSHEQFSLTFSPNVTVITGPNGSGKTSILEAIYIALQGSSFKGSDVEVLRSGAPWWQIRLQLPEELLYKVTFNPSQPTKRKQFVIDEKTSYRLPPKYKTPVVLFEPDDLHLLYGSPARRRQFIDRFITQLNPLYGTSLRKYEQAIRQRNALLKQSYVAKDELFVWDIALSEYGAYIITQRILFIEQINLLLEDAYRDIAQKSDTVSVHYSHTYVGDVKAKLFKELQERYSVDSQIGTTTVGPHRHDLIFNFNNSPALSTASRGEVRTIILALKFLEVAIIEKITGKKPIILLDDVFSELDITRQKSLSETIKTHQIVITSTHVLSESDEFSHVEL